MEYCCKEMERNDGRNGIISQNIMNQCCIRGEENTHGDGYGYQIDDTEYVKINFCPWCGKKLQEVE